MQKAEEILATYDYKFSADIIAKEPAVPRDSARILVYDRATSPHGKMKKYMLDTYLNLDRYVPPNAVMVFNETKVIPARLIVRKPTGGKVAIFYLGAEDGFWKVMSDPKMKVGSRVHIDGTAGSSLAQQSGPQKVFFDVTRLEDKKYYFLRPSFKLADTEKILTKYGKTPIPPYIKGSPLSENALRKKYQTVFAKEPGSVAAPTASLHFTNRVFKKLERKGVQIVHVTLHVNLGTFAPLTEGQIEAGKLHSEFYEISRKTAETINNAKHEGRPIVAVGTTVVRALESAADKFGQIKKLEGSTDLFIREGYKLKCVDQLITNFHVPRSSLLMMVSEFVPRDKLLELYRVAMDKKFRFFSFGDGMYIR